MAKPLTVSAIITSHDDHEAAENMVAQLRAQKHLPCEILLFVSGIDDEFRDYPGTPAVTAHLHEPDYADWGHAKRAKGLGLATGDYVGFFNDDDTYSSKYIGELANLAWRSGADIVACDFVSKFAPSQVALTMPAIGHITSGNFIVRTKLAQRVGYNHRHYEADGQFIEDLIEAGATFRRVPKALYVHQ